MPLYHYSEEPGIGQFVPRLLASRPDQQARVWAVDAPHAPLYWFPRDCPRVCFWPIATTAATDRAWFRAQTTARMVIAIEGAWLDQLRQTDLYEYRFSTEDFQPEGGAQPGPGYYVTERVVTPQSVVLLDDLLARLVAAGVEVRLVPSLWPLYHWLQQRTLHYSMIRMRNAQTEGVER